MLKKEKEPQALSSKERDEILVSLCDGVYSYLIRLIYSRDHDFSDRYIRFLKVLQKDLSKVDPANVSNPMDYIYDETSSSTAFVRLMSADHRKLNPYYKKLSKFIEDTQTEIKAVESKYVLERYGHIDSIEVLVTSCFGDLGVIIDKVTKVVNSSNFFIDEVNGMRWIIHATKASINTYKSSPTGHQVLKGTYKRILDDLSILENMVNSSTPETLYRSVDEFINVRYNS